jgi:hypothetical protein
MKQLILAPVVWEVGTERWILGGQAFIVRGNFDASNVLLHAVISSLPVSVNSPFIGDEPSPLKTTIVQIKYQMNPSKLHTWDSDWNRIRHLM